MGVPKFFRWQSQRYPCLSEVVKEYQIPEFDNLYLDMNGIIHPCSHPDDSNPHFRITEEDIFKNIFHYIEVLFRMIRPRKVFFMAVDGVAPRAKMNQQRGRRFRSAREAQDREREALNRGEKLPTEKRFDSNCITPGTGFMVRLNAQLRFFVARKISEDPLWRQLRVILSGHDVPGEGEHKVMEFIRYEKSLSDYDPNTRHCLYGLDADLIVLGLCTHEPHFSLLREEVLFTRQQTKRTTVPEEMKFYLLHLSLFREYLEYEFSSLKTKLPFEFDLERIIDDWVMLGFLVGNDFVPHLPNLHIKEDALPIIYSAYKRVLPTLEGYITDGGALSLTRFEALMSVLTEWELDRLEDSAADKRWLRGKQTCRDIRLKGKSKTKVKTMEDFESFSMFEGLDEGLEDSELEPSKNKSVFGEITTNLDSDLEDGEETLAELEYRQLRRHYYKTKMNIDIDDEAALEQAVEYVRAIQWILHYYFDGVCSWSWFYPSHYTPYIGDVRGFCQLPDLLHFDMARPFLPYEQLLGVLPAASQDCVPPCLRSLMTSEASPIIDYYPTDFESDLNGKQQDWEAVVLIPFIDQDRLLDAIQPLYSQLTPEERSRNVQGDAYVYTRSEQNQGRTEAPGYFPALEKTFAVRTARPRDAFVAERSALRKGLLPGTRLDVHFAGFPTLKHVLHTFELSRQKVKVFSMPSNSDSMILTVKDAWDGQEPNPEQEARQILGTQIFVSWPHLVEAKVTSVSTQEQRYELRPGSESELKVTKLTEADRTVWIGQMHDIKNKYENHLGIRTGDVPVLVHATPMTGRKYIATSAGSVTLEKQWSAVARPYALQTCVSDIASQDPSFVQYSTVDELFSVGSHCFVLASQSYGVMGKVLEVTDKGRVRLDVTLASEPNFSRVEQKQARLVYFPSYVAAQKLGITSHLVSRLTGCIMLQQGATKKAPTQGNIVGELEEVRPDREATFNCAVEVKHNRKNEEMPGWSRRVDDHWQYSGKMIDVLREYIQKFPELVEFLGLNTEGYKFFDGDVWPDQEVRGRRVRELREWLASLECSRAERWPCGGAMLEPELVAALEAAVDSHRPNRAHTRLSVKPHLVYKPSLLGGSAVPDPAAQYRLYDRVINVREGFSVPLGAKGTVIGIRDAAAPADVLYDVLFDQPFPGGLALRCSAGRGYKMPPYALLNISHGLRLANGEQPEEQQQQRQQQQQQRRQQPQQPYATVAGRAVPEAAGGQRFQHSPGSPFHVMPRTSSGGSSSSPLQVGSGRLAHLHRAPPPPMPPMSLLPAMPQPPPALPVPGDEYSDIWRELQRRPPPANTAVAMAAPRGPALETVIAASAARAAQAPLAQQRQADPCQRLLDMMQYMDGGVPRYTYAAAPGGQFVCTVLLPGGHAYRGGPAPSRDQASEKAAAAALVKLGTSRAAAAAPPPAPSVLSRRPENGGPGDLLSLLRTPVRATTPSSPQPPPPPPPAADITQSLLSMLSIGGEPPPSAAAAAQNRAAGRGAPPRGGGTTRRETDSPRAGHPPPRGAQNGAAGAAGRASSPPAAAAGSGAAFVPMQVTKKATPRKDRRRGAGPASPGQGPPPTRPPAEEVAVSGEDPAAAPAAAAAAKPAGKPASGRLFRKAPKKTRLACKF